MKNKYIFFAFWLCLLTLPIYTILKNSNLELVFSKPNVAINFVQRISGLIIYTLLPLQIILGAFMRRLTEKFGSWIFWFHITQAILIYTLILVHPISSLILRWKVSGVVDPFYVFSDFCLLCKTKSDLYFTFGRIAFLSFTIAYIAGKFRTVSFLRKHWRKLHLFNYVGFFAMVYHSYHVGSDPKETAFFWYFILAILVVSSVIVYRLFRLFKKN